MNLGIALDKTSMASEALVYMVVDLKSHRKLPVVFYFINTVSPDTQKILILHALEALHEHGIKVVSVTMDRYIHYNISMCTILRCQLKLNQCLKTYFIHFLRGKCLCDHGPMPHAKIR